MQHLLLSLWGYQWWLPRLYFLLVVFFSCCFLWSLPFLFEILLRYLVVLDCLVMIYSEGIKRWFVILNVWMPFSYLNLKFDPEWVCCWGTVLGISFEKASLPGQWMPSCCFGVNGIRGNMGSAVNFQWVQLLNLPILHAVHPASCLQPLFLCTFSHCSFNGVWRGSEIRCKCSICCPNLECMGRFSGHLFHRKTYFKTTFKENSGYLV